MNDLNLHYRLLLGLTDDWKVVDVDLDLTANQVIIDLEYSGGKLCCPECSESCSRNDTAPKRTWRHLDTMQFTTEIRAAVPRSKCLTCGVKTIAVPRAGKHSRFTLMFEAFGIRVLQAAANVSRAATLLRLSWDSVHKLIERAVQRGLDRRSLDSVNHVGMDEKSLGKGHDYVSVMTDLDHRRVLDVSKDRTIAAADELWQTLNENQREEVESVSMDMWQAFMTSAEKNAPNAEIVHDKFHVSKYLGDAVDKVRRQEHRELKAEGDERLTGLRQMLLYNEENLNEDQQIDLQILQKSDLRTGRAWALKENFRHFWDSADEAAGKRFFDGWYGWAMRSRLEPIKKVARMLKGHLPGLMSYFNHYVTNALSEGFNSKIQSIKSAARGFRSFANYRLRILFYCGKLDLDPVIPSH
ncbi:ISL3 family transposase [Rhodopirellula europaea]|uniref:ISL3 family transposase n=1 Tax=Rhodopirellula europaea TaxID=1263866 RepID=UPI003D26F042|tara:strand:- start:8422 stop:9657 length:1236 start_codon:yes stop_codon:yes gene_type:complete